MLTIETNTEEMVISVPACMIDALPELISLCRKWYLAEQDKIRA